LLENLWLPLVYLTTAILYVGFIFMFGKTHGS